MINSWHSLANRCHCRCSYYRGRSSDLNEAADPTENPALQDGYPSKVFIKWFRVICAYYENNTLPLNVTTIDIADIKSTIMVRSAALSKS